MQDVCACALAAWLQSMSPAPACGAHVVLPSNASRTSLPARVLTMDVATSAAASLGVGWWLSVMCRGWLCTVE